MRAIFETGDAKRVTLDIGGKQVVYDAEQGKLGEAPLKPVEGRIVERLRSIVLAPVHLVLAFMFRSKLPAIE